MNLGSKGRDSRSSRGMGLDDSEGRNWLKLGGIIGGAVLVLILLFVGWSALSSLNRGSAIDTSKYQAVFFTNGQVYFGKLTDMNDEYFKLNDIFYLQTKATAAEKDSQNPQETAAEQSADVELIKLGDEVHGPEDEMIISKDQVLFFENLKNEGKVAGSINEYKSQGKK
ncbi:hypothetical protein JNJ66_06495 [Candidatus Saccharibacteria bacterium]|nr:hypothetical protein [Candidatus Saccharibacteria bacterium]